MRAFHSAREAKEFLVSKILLEAEREGVSLSEAERKMLYFSETDWTLPDMQQVYDEFSGTYDQDDYEAKIGRLVRRAYRGVSKQSGDEYNNWWSAVHHLSKQGHYVSVMISQANLKPRFDQLKLLGAGLAIAALLLCGDLLVWKYGIDFGRYIPSTEATVFYVWAAGLSLSIGYLLLWSLLGKKSKKGLGYLVRKLFSKPATHSRLKKRLP